MRASMKRRSASGPNWSNLSCFQITRNLMIDRLRRQSVVNLESVVDFDWLNVIRR